VKVAVLGATGFVGRHVVEALASRGHSVKPFGRTRAGGGVATWDPSKTPPPLGALDGCEAIVNLVGIKRETPGQDFEAAHVRTVERLIDAARSHHVRRVVHISVVCARPDPMSGYHDTKWRAERVLLESGLDATVLRPAVIYGRGDDMLTHLTKLVRFMPVFPVVGRGESLMQPVDVRDVADAVARCLATPASVGKIYDVVGPERLALGRIVTSVAEALRLSTWIVPTPRLAMRVAVRLMQLTATPLSTPSQLRMLEEGLVGDPEPARRELGLVTRSFTPSGIRELVDAVPPLFGASLRLIDGPASAAWLSAHASSWKRAAALAAVAVGVEAAASRLPFGIWLDMLAAAGVLVPLAFAWIRLDWRRLMAPGTRPVAVGVGAAVALYVAGALVVRFLSAWPAAAAEIAMLYGWRDQVPRGLAPLLLPLIVLAEDIVWRGGVTLPLAGRFGAWAGSFLAALGFALAHVALGSWVLLAAAFGAGLFWSALAIRTRGLAAPLLSHILWDVTILFVCPYSA
jgi:NADH dehydrogenase